MQNNEFSFYTSQIEPGRAGHQNEVITLQKVYELISSLTYKKVIEQVRQASKKADQDLLKKKLNYFTVSGVFAPGTRKAENLLSHSGLMQIDIDAKHNPNKAAGEIKKQITNDPHLALIFLSPTGTGVKAVACISPDRTKHTQSFDALESHFKANYGIVIDKQCKDVCRPFFVSYDPESIVKSAIEINLPTIGLSTIVSVGALNPLTESELEKRHRHIEKLCSVIEENKIDITGNYDFYRNIGFAIADGLGESGRKYYHRICTFYPGYTVVETDKQFEACKKPGGRKWSSLFGIASDYGIVIYPKDKQVLKPSQIAITGQVPKQNQIANSQGVQTTDIVTEDLKFWTVRKKTLDDGSKQFKDVVIDDVKLLNLLRGFGYRRHDVPGGFSFVQVKHNIVNEVQPQQIQDTFFSYLYKLPEKIEDYVTRGDLESKVVKQSEKFFGKNRLTILKREGDDLTFNQDTKNESFVYYKNGFVKCNKGDYTFHEYKDLKKSIWKTQLKERDFLKLPADNRPLYECCGFYAKFIWNVAGKDIDRFASLMTLIGYLLHDYKETKLKAIVLTDSSLSDGNNGRTGKTLFGKAIEQIRDVCELNGKEFKADKSFKYQEAKLSTQIVFLNDAMKRFNLETLYNDITEGITIEKKNQSPVKLKVKYLITTNATIKTEGASSKDRITEYEFSAHYSDKFHPKDEFGHWFFTEWSEDEWNRFDNFMMFCLCLYLENGIIEPDPVNLKNRKLIDQSCKQFYDFIETKNVEPAVEFCLQETCDNFQSLFPDYEFYQKYPTRQFSKWLKLLPELHLRFAGCEMVLVKKNDANHFYTFKLK